jgi:hypothetical protein
MNKGLEKFEPVKLELNASALPEGVVVEGQMDRAGKSYILLNSIGSRTIPEGKYLADPASGQVELQWTQGIGSQDAPAPQARLMSVVIKGILTQKLPWGLVLLGVFLVVAVELLGIRSLSFAVGSYLSIGTTAAIFCGGLVKSLAERGMKQTEEGEARDQAAGDTRHPAERGDQVRTDARARRQRPHRHSHLRRPWLLALPLLAQAARGAEAIGIGHIAVASCLARR